MSKIFKDIQETIPDLVNIPLRVKKKGIPIITEQFAKDSSVFIPRATEASLRNSNIRDIIPKKGIVQTIGKQSRRLYFAPNLMKEPDRPIDANWNWTTPGTENLWYLRNKIKNFNVYKKIFIKIMNEEKKVK